MRDRIANFWNYIELDEKLIDRLKNSFRVINEEKENLEKYWATEKREAIQDKIQKELSDSRKLLSYLQKDYRSATKVYCTDFEFNYQDMLSEEIDVLELKAGYTEDGILYIRCPGLLPNRRNSSAYGKNIDNVFYEPLDALFTKINPKNEKFTQHCVLLIVQVYNENRKTNLLIDNDNLESKYITNMIKDHFLFTDSPIDIDTMYAMRQDKENATEIYLIPDTKFSEWYKEWFIHRKPPKKLLNKKP